MSDAETVAICSVSVSGFGRVRCGQPEGEVANNDDLSVKRKEDSRISIGILVADDQFCFEMTLPESHRELGFRGVDMDMIE